MNILRYWIMLFARVYDNVTENMIYSDHKIRKFTIFYYIAVAVLVVTFLSILFLNIILKT